MDKRKISDRYEPAGKAERETVVTWDDEEKVVHLYSASPRVWRRLAKRGVKAVRVSRNADSGRVHGRFFEIPLRWFRWSVRQPKPVTAAMRERGFSLKTHGKSRGISTEPGPEGARACPGPEGNGKT